MTRRINNRCTNEIMIEYPLAETKYTDKVNLTSETKDAYLTLMIHTPGIVKWMIQEKYKRITTLE